MHGARVTLLSFIAVISSLSVDAQELQNVVTLTQCIDGAMTNGPDVKLAAATLAQAQAQYAQAVAGNSFNLSGTGGAERSQPIVSEELGQGTYTGGSTSAAPTVATDSPSVGVTLSNGSATQVSASGSYNIPESSGQDQTSRMSVSASQTLWDGYLGGRDSATVQQAALTLQEAQLTYQQSTQTITLNVKQAYDAMLGQQGQIAVLQQTLKSRQADLTRVQTLMDEQNATQIDLKQAQVNELTTELDLRLAQSTLVVDRQKLCNLVGFPPDKQYQVAEVPDQPVGTLDVDQCIKTALAQRADLKQLQLGRQGGDISLALKRSLSSPVVSASGGVSWTRDWTASLDEADWDVGVQVNVPIWDSGLVQDGIQQIQSQNQALDVQISQKIASISTDVTNAVYNLQDLGSRVDLAQKNVDLMQSQHDLAQAQFDEGVISDLDLLTASVNLTTAQEGLQTAIANEQMGVLNLQNVMGD